MTSTDERLERYLHDRSSTIDLPATGLDVITRRARRHRRRRSAALGSAVAAVLLGGTAVVIAGQPTADQEDVGSVGAAVVESPLEWSIAPVRVGLGWGSGTISDGTAVYSLSTAPGPDEATAGPEPRRLYRSEDGTDWEDVALPPDLFASGVAAADGSVYAVGTAAAGGDVTGVEVATSSDGGSGWDVSTVPLDLAALGDGFPGTVRAVDAEVAVSGDVTVVAVAVDGTVDVATVLPDASADSWYETTGGLARFTDTCSEDGAMVSTTMPSETVPPTTPASTEPPSSDPATPATDAPGADVPATDGSTGSVGSETPPAADPSGRPARMCDGEGEPTEGRTWAELGLTAEQAEVAEGRTYLFATGPDGALEQVDVRPGVTYADPSSSRLLAADDGFWLVTEEGTGAPEDMDPTVAVGALHSTDGRSWTGTELGSARSVLTAGVVAGRPVVVSIATGPADDEGWDQPVVVTRIESEGVATPVGVNELLDIPARAGIFAWGVGPLGVGVVLSADANGAGDDLVVATSLDGLGWSVQPLPEAEPGTSEVVNGLTITADAIKLRLNVREAGTDPMDGPDAQRLFVGTPAG